MQKRRELSEEEKADAQRLYAIWDKAKTTLGITQEEIAHQCGWNTQGAFSQYLLGKIPLNLDAVLRICQVLKVLPDEISPRLAERLSINTSTRTYGVEEPKPYYNHAGLIQSPIDDWESSEDLPVSLYAFVPRKKVHIIKGSNLLVIENEAAPHIPFSTSWIKSKGLKRSNLVFLEATDDSMEQRIRLGDILLIDRGQSDVLDTKTYALRYGDQLRVKRLLRRYDGAMILQSNNQLYRDEIIPPEALQNQVEIVGRVIWTGGEV